MIRRLAAGGGAREPDRGHVRLGAGVREAPARQAEAPRQAPRPPPPPPRWWRRSGCRARRRSRTAATIAGCACPCTIALKPLWKSRYSLPSTSQMRAPSPRVDVHGPRVAAGGTTTSRRPPARARRARSIVLRRARALGEALALALAQVADQLAAAGPSMAHGPAGNSGSRALAGDRVGDVAAAHEAGHVAHARVAARDVQARRGRAPRRRRAASRRCSRPRRPSGG